MNETKPGLLKWLNVALRNERIPPLGKRELLIMQILWKTNPLSAQEILAGMAVGRSLSTVQSTLERLYRKNLVRRSKKSRSYYYTPALSREALISTLLHSITDEIANGDMAPVISGFADYIDKAGHDTP